MQIITENWGDVFLFPTSHNKASGSVFNTLNPREEAVLRTIQEAVAVVQSAADERVYQSSSGVDSERSADRPDLPQLEEAGATHGGNVCCHG